MGYARKSLVSLQDTPYYHCIARCVRRAWLWGFDEYAGRDYSHRKPWVVERMAYLSQIFAVEICAYAVMANHYHLVVYVDRERCQQWSAQVVVARWERLFRLPQAVQRWRSGEALEAERALAERYIQTWRRRLHDISWFMRCLNEYLARRANAEDQCTGRFWEGRFRSQALLDEAGLLTAMAYVDLNPVRAGVAATPETSQFTSVAQRIRAWRAKQTPNGQRSVTRQPVLRAFREPGRTTDRSLPYRLQDYLRLLDYTGRAVRADKPGAIDASLPAILDRLAIDTEAWTRAMRPAGNVFGRAIGRLDRLRLHATTLGQSWIRGLSQARALYGAR